MNYLRHGTGSEKKNEKEKEKLWKRVDFQKYWFCKTKIPGSCDDQQHEIALRN